MKKTWTSRLVIAAMLAVLPLVAQDHTANELKPTRPNSPSDQVKKIPDQGRKIGLPEKPRPGSALTAVARPDIAQPTELKEMIARFQTERELYLKRQRQLALQLRQANDEQRKALREQMRENLDQWREQQLEFRTQLRDRAVELRRELQGQLREVVNEGSKEGETNRRRQ
jgi:hypothetical protein